MPPTFQFVEIVATVLNSYSAAFLGGLAVTLKLSSIAWSSGIFGGSLLGWLAARYPYVIGYPSRLIAFFLSGVPVLIFLLWLHYPAQSIFGIVVDPFYTAALTFSTINLFSVCSLVRIHIEEFPVQYVIAAKVCGLTSRQIAFKIQLPIILRQILPGLLLVQVTMLHMTLFASLISVDELLRVAQRINSNIYRPVEIYTALGVFFLAVSLPVNGAALLLRKRFTRAISER